jgi:hypothetical protein
MQPREFLCKGDKLIFREGRTKGLGIVMATDYDRAKYPNLDSDKKDIDKSEVTEKGDAKGGKGVDAKTGAKGRPRGESKTEKPVVKAS